MPQDSFVPTLFSYTDMDAGAFLHMAEVSLPSRGCTRVYRWARSAVMDAYSRTTRESTCVRTQGLVNNGDVQDENLPDLMANNFIGLEVLGVPFELGEDLDDIIMQDLGMVRGAARHADVHSSFPHHPLSMAAGTRRRGLER